MEVMCFMNVPSPSGLLATCIFAFVVHLACLGPPQNRLANGRPPRRASMTGPRSDRKNADVAEKGRLDQALAEVLEGTFPGADTGNLTQPPPSKRDQPAKTTASLA